MLPNLVPSLAGLESAELGKSFTDDPAILFATFRQANRAIRTNAAFSRSHAL
jgi:hypothetical protein